jgi:CheY-like chemotaxis protein
MTGFTLGPHRASPHAALPQPLGGEPLRTPHPRVAIARTRKVGAAPRRRPAGPSPLLAGLTVLVVEDHHDSRDVLRQMLQGYGARVVEAAHGEEALDLLDRPRPAAILCDLVMPVMDGFRFVAAVKASPRWRRIPIIAVTALGGELDYRRTWEAGFDAHLTKPVQPDHVVAVIRAVTGRPPAPTSDAP